MGREGGLNLGEVRGVGACRQNSVHNSQRTNKKQNIYILYLIYLQVKSFLSG